jgi:hypothetical protein
MDLQTLNMDFQTFSPTETLTQHSNLFIITTLNTIQTTCDLCIASRVLPAAYKRAVTVTIFTFTVTLGVKLNAF